MKQPIFEVVQAGMQASWQDLGRRHSFQHGFTESGVMDVQAAMWANKLLDRAIHEPVIEITLGLFELLFTSPCRIAITGADLGASLNSQAAAPWRNYAVSAGTRLKFTMPKQGLRAYLAIDAEFELDKCFSSVSMVPREELGGQVGLLRQGDLVSGIRVEKELVHKAVSRQFVPDYQEPLRLDLIPGYQFHRFPRAARKLLINTEYQIQNSSNRMAYSLKGEPLGHDIHSLFSEGIAYGAVQVPPDGQPVILLNDRQTMGGYPKVGCISRMSGAALSQRFYPTSVRFRIQSAEAARRQYLEHLAFFQKSRQSRN